MVTSVFCFSYNNHTGTLGSMPDTEAIAQVQTFETSSQGATQYSTAATLESSTSTSDGDPDVLLPNLPNIPAIPPKTCKKILAGEYLDMAELRPESWRLEELLYLQVGDLHTATNCSTRQLTRRRPVTDIVTWMECFSSMAAIITSKHPKKAPQLFSYQRTIVSASQSFDAAAWVAYDARYRRKAALSKSFDWGTIDTGLYSECFIGRAKPKQACSLCLSDQHVDRSCPIVTTPTTYNQSHGNLATKNGWGQGRGNTSSELCGLFNHHLGNMCRYAVCKFTHICSLCRLGPHPASQCNRPRRALLGPPPFSGDRANFRQ